ncbi:bifunctional DNase/RNase [Methanohalophilus levihalophilus]|uniref:bifunctional nuclease family protein n=1 Tax=Methanohalophilus levihalophilus TaxID=1431282 RepID=UPI001AE1D9AA|nr:bifunctional nuclease family protein [Methanohalophilus levihalophilus]MBP2030239.1 bifunctional DNase/RNase [Methanohalophilus levihalophilus]
MEGCEGICELSVKGVYLVEVTEGVATAIILESKSGNLVPIYVGHLEALSINQAFNNQMAPRPLTHDLLMNILQRNEISVENVIIDEMIDGIFYASITIRKNGVNMEFDARPSDCIAVALRAKIPIYMSEEILEAEAINPERLEGAEVFDTLL